MNVETIRMSSKGQIEIPLGVREQVCASEGSVFAVVSGGKDSIILKKINMPSKEEMLYELKELAKEGSKRAEKLGIKESDVPSLVHKARENKRR